MESPVDRVLNKGEFSTNICQQVCNYLTLKEVAAVSAVSKRFRSHVTMRFPGNKKHPLLNNTSNSIIESKLYQEQKAIIKNESKKASQTAKEKIKLYLPLDTQARNNPEHLQNKKMIKQYQTLMRKVTTIDLKAAWLVKNSLLTPQQRSSIQWQMKAQYYQLCQAILKIQAKLQDQVESGIVNLMPRTFF